MLWRVHRTQGYHVYDWDGFRTYGPLPTMRFDPHPPPAGESTEGVCYAAADSDGLATALAEIYQQRRTVDVLSGAPRATSWTPTRPLQLLDLTGRWALRNGAAQALTAAPTSVCQSWSRAIRSTWPDLDGLWSSSTMTGAPSVTLWSPARDSFPAAPAFSRPLSHPMLLTLVHRIATEQLGYAILT